MVQHLTQLPHGHTIRELSETHTYFLGSAADPDWVRTVDTIKAPLKSGALLLEAMKHCFTKHF
jgi:hypothetical protein